MTAKSVWGGVCCSTPRDYEAIRSWFGPLVPGAWGNPLKAEILTRLEDDKELRIRALFRREDGEYREAVRTLGRTYTIRLRPASAAIMAGISQ